MLPIRFQVCQVIDDVNGAGSHAQEDEAGDGPDQRLYLEELTIKSQGCEDEPVFNPLAGAHGLQNRSEHDGDDIRKGPPQQGFWMNPGGFPDRIEP